MSTHWCTITGRYRDFGGDGWSTDGDPRTFCPNAVIQSTPIPPGQPTSYFPTRQYSKEEQRGTSMNPAGVLLLLGLGAVLLLLAPMVWAVITHPIICVVGFAVWGVCLKWWLSEDRYGKSVAIQAAVLLWPVLFLVLTLFAASDLLGMLPS